MRHILVVNTARDWRIAHPIGSPGLTPRGEAHDCLRVERAAWAFMRPPRPRRLSEIPRFLFPKLPVPAGAYWVENWDGNLAVGSRLPAAEELAYTGVLR